MQPQHHILITNASLINGVNLIFNTTSNSTSNTINAMILPNNIHIVNWTPSNISSNQNYKTNHTGNAFADPMLNMPSNSATNTTSNQDHHHGHHVHARCTSQSNDSNSNHPNQTAFAEGTNRWHTNKIQSRNFPCTVCGKSFKRKYNLSMHARVHTKIKPFKCSICNKSFSQKHR